MPQVVFIFLALAFSIAADAAELRPGETAIFHAPPSIGKVIASHISKMEEKGYFEEFSSQDFFHGHLIMRGELEGPYNLEQLESQISGFLYHTAEKNRRWMKEGLEGLSVEQRTPRSIFGGLDGTIRPAIEMIDIENDFENRYRSYVRSGTVYNEDIVNHNPNLSQLEYHLGRALTPTSLVWHFKNQTRILYLRGQFTIMAREEGHYSTPSQKHYSIYFEVRNSKISVGYPVKDEGPYILSEDHSHRYPW